MNKKTAHRIALRLAYEALKKYSDAGSEPGQPDDPKVELALEALVQAMYNRWQKAETTALVDRGVIKR